MSDTKKTRVNQAKEELKEKLVDQNIEKFKTGLQELEEKYGYRLEPTLHFSKMGVFPQIELQRIVKKEETKPEVVV